MSSMNIGITRKTYNNIMGTYLTLDSMKTKICGLKIRVRPDLTLTSVFPQPRGFQTSVEKGRDPGTPHPA